MNRINSTSHRLTVLQAYRIEMHTNCCPQIIRRATVRHSNKYLRNIIIGDSTVDSQIKLLMCSERNGQVKALYIIYAKRRGYTR
jgi:hypothetical protein